jgi:hypothetical protein
MEWVFASCATPAVLGKCYLRHDQLAFTVEHCKAVEDYSIYLHVCQKGKASYNLRNLVNCSRIDRLETCVILVGYRKTFCSGEPLGVFNLPICLVVLAKKHFNWTTLDFLAYFAGRCSLLDIHCLYASLRDANFKK